MSAPAIKSSLPGVGGTPPTTGHSMLPMNMMAQKVVQGSETSTMKPMPSTGISYVTLQPPAQPLSLVQDHRPQVYPPTTSTTSATTTYTASATNVDKESDVSAEKQMPNGLEAPKPEPEQVQTSPTKIIDTVKINVESNTTITPPEPQQQPQPQPQPQIQQSQATPIQIQQSQVPVAQTQQQPQTLTSSQVKQETPQSSSSDEKAAETSPPPVSSQPQNVSPQVKSEEKKTPTTNTSTTVTTTNNSNAKETEEQSVPTNVTQNKAVSTTPHKAEETPVVKVAENTQQKPKPQVCPAKPAVIEHSASAQVTAAPSKVETKVSSSPSRVNKRKLKETSDSRAQGHDNSSKPKRKRRRTEPFQSPLPEIAMIVKTLTKPSASKAQDDKLIVFYKNEFLAVRNTEGSFYVCQAMQNIYKSSRRIRIRWLSQDKTNGEIYSPDFYDFTDFDCILTNLNLNKIDKNKFQLSKFELLRTENILKRAIDVEAGVSEKPSVTEEHPDGLDLSLYKDESQLKKRKKSSSSSSPGKQKRNRKKVKQSESNDESESSSEESDDEEVSQDKKKSSPIAKKRTSNKTLAIVKSVAKGPSRAERALNRGAKSADSVNNVPAKTEKKPEQKKVASKIQSNNGAGATRVTKVRGNSQPSSTEPKSNSTRPKRGTSSTSSKARGRA